jgi:hypothetical protein
MVNKLIGWWVEIDIKNRQSLVEICFGYLTLGGGNGSFSQNDNDNINKCTNHKINYVLVKRKSLDSR